MAEYTDNFWLEFCGKVGAPIFAATLVACLMIRDFDMVHGGLMGVGLFLIWLNHWATHKHRR